jgi:hypothetical protein
MKKISLTFFAICLVLLTVAESRAQEGPPKVLSILREEIKAGRGAAHENLETGYVQASRKAKWPVYYMAMTTEVGGSDAWFVTAYPSFAALAKDRDDTRKNAALTAEYDRLDAKDAEFRTGQRSFVCVLNEEMSYGGPVDISQMRYFSVNAVRVRPGHDQEYLEARKLLVEAVKKANPTARSAFYSVAAGLPNGTYLVFTPRKSLAELDPNPAIAKAVQDALGDENRIKRQKLLGDSVISSETTIYAFNPKMSYVPKEWAKTGGDFWTPKPPPAVRAVAKKQEAEKTPSNK